MSLFFLRVVLLFEILIAAVAIYQGQVYLSWEHVPHSEIVSSPDAMFIIENLHSSWWFFKGICVGMTTCIVLMAIAQRRSIVDGTWWLKVHWAALFIPIIVVFWFGRGIGYGA